MYISAHEPKYVWLYRPTGRNSAQFYCLWHTCAIKFWYALSAANRRVVRDR